MTSADTDTTTKSNLDRAKEAVETAKLMTSGPYMISQNAATKEWTFDALRSNGTGEVIYRYKWLRNVDDLHADLALRNATDAFEGVIGELEEARRDLAVALKISARYQSKAHRAQTALTAFQEKCVLAEDARRGFKLALSAVQENLAVAKSDLEARTRERDEAHAAYLAIQADEARLQSELADLKKPVEDSQVNRAHSWALAWKEYDPQRAGVVASVLERLHRQARGTKG